MPTQSEEKVIYLNYFDNIDPPRVQGLMNFCANIIATEQPTHLYFLLSSQGGCVVSGVTLYNFLKSLPLKVTMHNMGAIDSIATVIFLAGEERFASPHSSFLFHGVQMGFPQGAQLTLPHLLEQISRVQQDQEKISGIISSNSTLSHEEIETLFHQGGAKSCSFAHEKGIVHKICEPKIPKGAKLVSFGAPR